MLICGEIASTLGESLAVFRALATFVRALIPCVDTECHRVPQPSAAVPGYAHRRTRTGSCVLLRTGGAGQLAPGPHARYVRRTHASLGRTVRTAYRVVHAPQAEPAPARTAGRLAAAYAFRRGGRWRGAGVAAAPALPWLGLGLGFEALILAPTLSLGLTLSLTPTLSLTSPGGRCSSFTRTRASAARCPACSSWAAATPRARRP